VRETIDWTEVGADAAKPPARRRRLGRASTKGLLGGSIVVLALSVAGAVGATTGDAIREGVRNGTATKETRIISKVTGEKYGTRQSNISTGSTAGGAAIYGCRRATKECTRHVNLSNGPAAAFATKGLVPFTLSSNAIGKVTGLNADRLDDLDAAQLINAARAGKADSAATADTATALSGRETFGKMTFVSPSASNADAATARAAATEVSLRKFGPFEIYGKCYVDTSVPEVHSRVFVRSTVNGVLLDGGGSGYLSGSAAYLDTTTPEAERELDAVDVSTNLVEIDLDEDSGGLITADGTMFEFRTIQAAKSGTIAGGDGPYGPGDRCGFAASVNG
jgi:hypothetical protein